MRPGTLWVPRRLANALVRNGFGKAVKECLTRVSPLPKSATSLAINRPKPIQHYSTLKILEIIPESSEILLVDDVITRGATMLGAANRLKVTFPRCHIRAFAAMRTISSAGALKRIIDPCIGDINIVGQDSFREP